MARPKRINGVPTAREAIIACFWDFYRERPLEDITVKEVCEAAHVNKTTFYYHFQDLREVLDSIEDECLPREAPDMLASLITATDPASVISQFITDMGPRFEQYCLLLSSKGDPNFAKQARHIMTSRWCESLGITYDSLPADVKMSIRFAMGGTTSVFADHGDGEPFDADAFAHVVLIMIAPFAEKAMRNRHNMAPAKAIAKKGRTANGHHQ